MDLKTIMTNIEQDIGLIASTNDWLYITDTSTDYVNDNAQDMLVCLIDRVDTSNVTNFSDVNVQLIYNLTYIMPLQHDNITSLDKYTLLQALHDLQIQLTQLILDKSKYPDVHDIRYGQMISDALHDSETDKLYGLMYTLDFTIHIDCELY